MSISLAVHRFTCCRGSWALALALAVTWSIGPCQGRIGSGVVSLTSANFETFVHSSDRVIVDFYNVDGEQTEFEQALRKVRGLGDTVPFAKVDAAQNPEIAEHYVTTGKYPQLVWFQKGEVTKYHRTLRQSEDITTFVMDLDRDPLIAVDSIKDADGINRAVFIRCRKASTLYKELEVVASKHMDTVAFLQVESSDEQVQWLADNSVVNTYAGEHTAADMELWVRSMLTTSEEIPEQPVAEDGTTVVVGKSFEKMVLREDKDVFLMVYAPWCGFCRKATPIWTALAREMASVEHLVVAKMDGSRNRLALDNFMWSSYPTFFYVRAGEQAPAIFDGNRTLDNLFSFAKEHSTQAITVNIDSVTEFPEIEL